MSKICPLCGGVAEFAGKNWLGEDVLECAVCHEPGNYRRFKEDATLFHHLAQYPEAMAAKLVYRDGEHEPTFSVVVRGVEQKMGHECWRSTIIPGACWAEYDRAYAATVEKLKEVYIE